MIHHPGACFAVSGVLGRRGSVSRLCWYAARVLLITGSSARRASELPETAPLLFQKPFIPFSILVRKLRLLLAMPSSIVRAVGIGALLRGVLPQLFRGVSIEGSRSPPTPRLIWRGELRGDLE